MRVILPKAGSPYRLVSSSQRQDDITMNLVYKKKEILTRYDT